jgi:hypothetical protein
MPGSVRRAGLAESRGAPTGSRSGVVPSLALHSHLNLGAALLPYSGLALNLKANSLADDFNRNQSPSTRSSQSSYKTGSIICYGAGAGALVAGIVLYLIGHRAGRDAPTQVSLFSSLTPTELSLGVRGAFQ